MLQYSRLNHSSKTGSTILKPSPDFSMKSYPYDEAKSISYSLHT